MPRSEEPSTLKDEKSQRWQAILSEFEQSGLTQTAYCQQQGLALSTFSKWRLQLKSQISQNSEKPLKTKNTAKFKPLLTSNTAAVPLNTAPVRAIKAHLNQNLTLEWPEQTDPNYIANLIKELTHGI